MLFSYRPDFEFTFCCDESDFIFRVAAGGVGNADGDHALAQAAEHEKDVVEGLAVVATGQVVGVVELGRLDPPVEYAGEALPLVPWCDKCELLRRIGRRDRW